MQRLADIDEPFEVSEKLDLFTKWPVHRLQIELSSKKPLL